MSRSGVDPHAPVAQGIEHRFPKPGVAGSNPAGGTAEKIVESLTTTSLSHSYRSQTLEKRPSPM